MSKAFILILIFNLNENQALFPEERYNVHRNLTEAQCETFLRVMTAEDWIKEGYCLPGDDPAAE